MMIRENMIELKWSHQYVCDENKYAHDLSPKHIRNNLNFVQTSPDN